MEASCQPKEERLKISRLLKGSPLDTGRVASWETKPSNKQMSPGFQKSFERQSNPYGIPLGILVVA